MHIVLRVTSLSVLWSSWQTAWLNEMSWDSQKYNLQTFWDFAPTSGRFYNLLWIIHGCLFVGWLRKSEAMLRGWVVVQISVQNSNFFPLQMWPLPFYNPHKTTSKHRAKDSCGAKFRKRYSVLGSTRTNLCSSMGDNSICDVYISPYFEHGRYFLSNVVKSVAF